MIEIPLSFSNGWADGPRLSATIGGQSLALSHFGLNVGDMYYPPVTFTIKTYKGPNPHMVEIYC